MIVNHVDLDEAIVLFLDKLRYLVIENPTEFYKKAKELKEQSEGETGGFLLIKDDIELNFSKIVSVITDVLSIDMNDKKVQNALYKRLEGDFNKSNLIVDINKANSVIENILSKLFDNISIALSTTQPQIIDYIKAFDVKVEKTYDCFIEKIICYVNLLVELKGIKLLIFINARGYFSDEDIRNLFEHCEREQLYILFVESKLPKKMQEFEVATVITEDLCEILVNNG